MSRKVVIAGGFIVGILALVIYFQVQPAPEIEAMGAGEDNPILSYSSLAVAVLGFLTAIVSFIKEIISARAAGTKS